MKEYTVVVEVNKVVNLQINIVAESGIQVKQLRSLMFGDEVKKLVTLQIYIVAESEIQVKRLR